MRKITRRQALHAALAVAIGAGFVMRRSAAAAANLVATPQQPAVVPLAANAAAGAELLDIHVRAFTPPRRGSVEAVVSLGPAGKEIEVGRFAVFPSEAFRAAKAADQRTFRLNAGAALSASRGAPLVVQLRLVPTDDKISAEGASLTIDRIELVARPAP